MEMESLSILHWEISYLVQNMELRKFLMLEVQVGRFMETFRDLSWKMILVHGMELWEVLMMEVQTEITSLKYLHWIMLLM